MKFMIGIFCLVLAFPAVARHLAPPTVGQERTEVVILCTTEKIAREFFKKPAWVALEENRDNCIESVGELTYKVLEVTHKASIISKETNIGWILKVESSKPKYPYAITY